jgi:hypothetical protein
MIKYIFLSILLVPSLLFAQEIPLQENLDVQSYIKLLLESLGGFKGASSLAVVMVFIQIIMHSLRLPYFQSKLPPMVGKHKFLMIYFLSIVSGILALRIQGVDWMASLFHSNTLAAYQVFMHQAIKQAKEKT